MLKPGDRMHFRRCKQYTQEEIEVLKAEYEEKYVKALEVSTMFVFTLMHLEGETEKAVYDLRKEIDAQNLTKIKGLNGKMNECETLISRMNIHFRLIERSRILPTLAYKLKTFCEEYPDIGATTQQIQFTINRRLAKHMAILKNCSDNRVNNETDFKNKSVGKHLYYLHALATNVVMYSDATIEAIQSHLPGAKHEKPIQFYVDAFKRIKYLTDQMRDLIQKNVNDEEGYWYNQCTDCVTNINNILLGDAVIDEVNDTLHQAQKDYVWWWLARMTMYFTQYDYTSVGLSDDLAAAIPHDALMRGRVVVRLKQIARSLQNREPFEDIHDLIDEIQEREYKDLVKFVEVASIAERDPEKIRQHVIRSSKKEV